MRVNQGNAHADQNIRIGEEHRDNMSDSLYKDLE